jgi:hypothetical protein
MDLIIHIGDHGNLKTFRMQHMIVGLCLMLCQNSFAQKFTLTDSLTKAFNKLWDNNDTTTMYNMLQPDAFFKSPFQFRYGRDTMQATVLKTNPSRFKNCRTIEKASHVEENMCYSIGALTFSVYNEDGSYSGKDQQADYIMVFTRKKKGPWKVQMMIYHE